MFFEENVMINTRIAQLVNYGLSTGLIEADDKICITNNLLEALSLTDFVEPTEVPEAELEDILAGILDYAVSAGLIEDSSTYRDLFDTKLMGILTPRPSVIRKTFKIVIEVFFNIADALEIDPADLINASIFPERVFSGKKD